jgi:membrane protein YqaA with SNARE-associated domain
LHFIKHILARYYVWVWGLLKPLGLWGVFGIAFVDAAFLGIPMDPVVAGYVYSDRARFLWYAVMASAGSALGSTVVYMIGRKGGELVLRRRISKERFERIRHSFERREFWALMFPSMLPPPTPFKLFVLSAGVFEMHFGHFLLAIFTGRMARFLALSALTLAFGPQIYSLAGKLVREHLWATIAAVVAVAVSMYVIYRLWKGPVVELEHEIEHELQEKKRTR